MATLSSFFGDAQGSGTDSSIITDPRKMPFWHEGNPLYLSYSNHRSWYGSHENNFWYYTASSYQDDHHYLDPINGNDIDNNGSIVQSQTFPKLLADWAQYDSDYVLDSWVTVMDYSNEAGHLMYVNGFGAFGQYWDPATPVISKIRITVDGQAYTFKSHLFTVQMNWNTSPGTSTNTSVTLGYNHPMWGRFVMGKAGNTSYGDRSSGYPESYYWKTMSDDTWNNYNMIDPFGVPSNFGEVDTISIMNNWSLVNQLKQGLRYENSIKVECAINAVTDTTTNGTGSAGESNHRYTHRAIAKRVKDIEVDV